MRAINERHGGPDSAPTRRSQRKAAASPHPALAVSCSPQSCWTPQPRVSTPDQALVASAPRPGPVPMAHCASPQVQNVHGAFNALGGADRLNSNRECPTALGPGSPPLQVEGDRGWTEGTKGQRGWGRAEGTKGGQRGWGGQRRQKEGRGDRGKAEDRGRQGGLSPLLHALLSGDSGGRWPGPNSLSLQEATARTSLEVAQVATPDCLPLPTRSGSSPLLP